MAPVEKAYEPNRKEDEQVCVCSNAPGFTQAKKSLPERQMQNKKSQEIEQSVLGRKIK